MAQWAENDLGREKTMKSFGKKSRWKFILIAVLLCPIFSVAIAKDNQCPKTDSFWIRKFSGAFKSAMGGGKCQPPDERTALAEEAMKGGVSNLSDVSAWQMIKGLFKVRSVPDMAYLFFQEIDQVGYTEMDDPFYMPGARVVIGVEEGFDIYMSVEPADEFPGDGEVDLHVGSNNPWPPGASGSSSGDLFILGDYLKPYYAGKKNPGDPDDDYVVIIDFDPKASIIRLHGSPEDYALSPVCKPVSGTAIFLKKNNDMIGMIIGVFPDRLDLSGPRFEYARPPSMTPSIPGVDQVGGPGAQVLGWLTSDEAGNVYMAVGSQYSFEGVETDGHFYLVKYDNQGRRLWARKHGTPVGSDRQGPWSMVVAGDYLFITGSTWEAYGGLEPKRDMAGFVAKFDARTGDELKVIQITPDSQKYFGLMWGICADNAGNIYVAGSTSNNGYKMLPGLSPHLVKLRQSDLEVVWRRTIKDENSHPILTGGAFDEPMARIVFVPDGSGIPGKGHIYTGGFTDRGDFFGACPGSLDVWFAKHDDQGNRIWGKSFGVPGEHDYPWQIDADREGNFYIVGMTNGALDGQPYKGLTDGFIRKMDPDGNLIWTRLIGSNQSDIIYSLDIVGDEIFVSGYTRGDIAGRNQGKSDAWVGKLDLKGNILALRQLGTPEIDVSFSLTATPGKVFVSAQTEGSMVKPFEGGLDVSLTVLSSQNLDFAVTEP